MPTLRWHLYFVPGTKGSHDANLIMVKEMKY